MGLAYKKDVADKRFSPSKKILDYLKIKDYFVKATLPYRFSINPGVQRNFILRGWKIVSKMDKNQKMTIKTLQEIQLLKKPSL